MCSNLFARMQLISNLSPTEHRFDDGGVVFGFRSDSLDICRLVLSFEAGSFFQSQPLEADAASRLFSEGTMQRSPQQVAEFLDYRGIIIEKSKDTYSADISVYMLRKYADEMLPMLHEMLTQPLFGEQEFEVYKGALRQKIETQVRKTSSMAYRMFYEAVYGKDHRLTRFAVPADVDRLSLDSIRDFFHQHYRLSDAQIVLAGGYDDALAARCHELFGGRTIDADSLTRCEQPPQHSNQREYHHHMDSAQTTLRIGRRLPLRWDDMDYVRFMVLNTMLGGYFGSRLMSNIREDKGYTYGVYSATALSRDDIKFFITMDVGNEVARQAAEETYREIERLQQDKVTAEELDMVRRYMEGDFIRTVDGVFERAERFMQMRIEGISEHFTDNYFEAIRTTSPDDIQRLAQTYLRKEDLKEIIVGAGV